MSADTRIEWTDATWNPVTGCSVVSPGCTHCYAMRLAGGRLRHHPSRAGLTQPSRAGPVWTGEVRFNEQWLEQPLRWRKPRRIFVCAHGDLFHESVPDEWIDRVFAVMALCPRHTFQVLTKRPGRMRDYLSHGGTCIRVTVRHAAARHFKIDPGLLPKALPNVWLGVSAENQRRADERIPLLLETPAAVRFISAEPLLGRVNLRRLRLDAGLRLDALTGAHEGVAMRHSPLPALEAPLDWVIVGGESGPGARAMHLNWARELVYQCRITGAAVFVKQLGSNTKFLYPDEETRLPLSLSCSKGAEPSEWPEDLRVREWPVGAHAGD